MFDSVSCIVVLLCHRKPCVGPAGTGANTADSDGADRARRLQKGSNGSGHHLVIGVENTFLDKRVSNSHQVQIVDGEHLNGDSPDRCQAFQFRAHKAKMLAPEVPAGMKKPHDFSRFRIPPGDVGSFVAVAVKTGEC